MSNMYPFTHPTGAGKSGVIRARESRRLTSGTATIWTLSGIVLAACNHSSNNDNASTTASQQFRAAVWIADPDDATKTAVNLAFAYGATPLTDATMQNLATELHITPDEIDTDPTSGNSGSRTTFDNAAAKGTITATAMDASGQMVNVAGVLTLVRPAEVRGDGVITRVDPNDANVVQWGYTPSFSRDIPGEGAEAIYRSYTFRFEPNDADTYASPTIIMTFKIGGSQPVLNPVLRSEDTAFTITLDGLDAPANNPDPTGTIQVVVDGVAGAPIEGAGQFIVTSSLGINAGNTALNNDGGYYGIFSIDDDTGIWSYKIDDYSSNNNALLATTGGTPVIETISITYIPNVLPGANGAYRLYQESNTIDLVFTIMDPPASGFVSEAYIDDTPTPDAPPALDVL